jgi:7-cyano-7-deazaguanine reductase
MTDQIPLGQASSYPDRYSPDSLCAISRSDSRAPLGLGAELPFQGYDIWNAWELTWLDEAGLPRVAVAEILVPASSANIVESKSLKLYLGSLAMSQFATATVAAATIRKDLCACTDSDVVVNLLMGDDARTIGDFPGHCIDDLEVQCHRYEVDADLLSAGDQIVEEALHSHLLRSLCPVTNQPDIGSLLVSYRGAKIDPAGLLQYIVSFRNHNDFHEACVERMFMDILASCQPERLSVYACYQRRGGIDINPFRSNFEAAAPNTRLWRQ